MKRAWGHYFVIFDRPRFKVKLLRFKYAGKLSLQYHNQRNELWCFLSGGGHFEHGKEGFMVGSGDVVDVRIGDLHRFTAEKTSWILEIQYGKVCTETDIVRIDEAK